MRSSEQINELASAFAKSQASYTPVKKTKTGKVQGFSKKTNKEYSYEYKYADLADILQMALPILSSNGLSFSQPHELIDGKLRCVSRLMHSSGQWIESDGVEMSEDGTPQEFGIQSTYFRRYDGSSLLGIAPDEDTDASQLGDRNKQTSTNITQQTQQSNRKPADDKPHDAVSSLVGSRLTIAVSAVQRVSRPAKDDKPAKNYLTVWPDGLYDGADRFYVWDDKLFDSLLGKAQNKTCGFEISTKETGGKKFITIDKVLFVGEDVIESAPASNEPQDVDSSDIPF